MMTKLQSSEERRGPFKRVPHIYWKTWKNIVHLENLEKSWNFAKNNKNHGNIMEFCQSGNVGTLGYCGNDIFLIR